MRDPREIADDVEGWTGSVTLAEVAAALRALADENERLRGALEGYLRCDNLDHEIATNSGYPCRCDLCETARVVLGVGVRGETATPGPPDADATERPAPTQVRTDPDQEDT